MRAQVTRRPAAPPQAPRPGMCQCGHTPHAPVQCGAKNLAGVEGRCWCAARPHHPGGPMSDLDLGEDPNWWEPAEAARAQADLARDRGLMDLED